MFKSLKYMVTYISKNNLITDNEIILFMLETLQVQQVKFFRLRSLLVLHLQVLLNDNHLVMQFQAFV